MEGKWNILYVLFAERCKEEEKLDLHSFMDITVSVGEQMDDTFEILILNQMRLFVPKRSHWMKNYNANRGRAFMEICKHKSGHKKILLP